jgi:hypothetical protein
MASSLGSVNPSPQIQLELVSLTQLISNIGTHGIKQLAQAGVDPYTIHSLLALGERCPASDSCIRQIVECRNKQRSQRMWLYNLVEIGTQTNFLVDELLKRRAGENVLALLASFAPMVNEHVFVQILSDLFFLNSSNTDDVPGSTQLHGLRRAVMPFLEDTLIKDKIAHYSLLFKEIRRPFLTTETENTQFSSSIPPPKFITDIINQIYDLMSRQDDGYVLLYEGWHGAGWIAAYAYDVLQLPICAVFRHEGGEKCVEISSKYKDARIVIYPDREGIAVSRSRRGKLDSWLKITAEDLQDTFEDQDQKAWLVSCDRLNFWKANLPGSDYDRFHRKASEWAETYAHAQLDAQLLLDRLQLPASCGLSYFDLEQLQPMKRRVSQILTTLGLLTMSTVGPKSTNSDLQASATVSMAGYEQGKGGPSFQGKSRRPTHIDVHKKKFLRSPYWIDYNFSNAQEACYSALQESFPILSEDEAADLRRATNIATSAMIYAVILCHTDWYRSLRRMSMDLFYVSNSMIGWTEENYSPEELLFQILGIESGINLHDNLVAKKFDALVLINSSLWNEYLYGGDGVIWHIKLGEIKFGENTPDEVFLEQRRPSKIFLPLERDYTDQLKPYDCIPKVSVRASGTMFKKSLLIQREIFLARDDSSSDALQISSLQSHKEHTRLLITDPCVHEFTSTLLDELRNIVKWAEGFLFISPKDKEGVSVFKSKDLSPTTFNISDIGQSLGARDESYPFKVFYQQVTGNEYGQWLASLLQQKSPSQQQLIMVLQHDACINCTIKRLITFIAIKEMAGEIDARKDVCAIIIAGNSGLKPQHELVSENASTWADILSEALVDFDLPDLRRLRLSPLVQRSGV